MHAGIRFTRGDGSSGYCMDIVFSLRPALSGSCVVGHVNASAGRILGYSSSPMCGMQSSSSVASTSSLNSASIRNSALPLQFDAPSTQLMDGSFSPSDVWIVTDTLDDRILPSIPPLAFGPDAVIPVNSLSPSLQDVPISIFRGLRLLRALGVLPRSHTLPAGKFIDALPPVSGSRLGQFSGEFTATTWNAQALFCSDPAKFLSKVCYLNRLLDRSDMILISESHGTAGGNNAWRPPLGCSAWWSPGPSSNSAGVGIIIKNSFLGLFSAAPQWTIIWPGRAAMLSLRGSQGSMDIIVTYFHTGSEVTAMDKFGVLPDAYDTCNSFPRLRDHLRMRIGHSAYCGMSLSVWH
jgi:hypothetical protein